MIDNGIVYGSKQASKELIFNYGTVYVHTNIEKVPQDENNINADIYQYNEKLYTTEEFNEVIAQKQLIESELLTLHDITLTEINRKLSIIKNELDNLNKKIEELKK